LPSGMHSWHQCILSLCWSMAVDEVHQSETVHHGQARLILSCDVITIPHSAGYLECGAISLGWAPGRHDMAREGAGAWVTALSSSRCSCCIFCLYSVFKRFYCMVILSYVLCHMDAYADRHKCSLAIAGKGLFIHAYLRV
jgi:hypothetical protein